MDLVLPAIVATTGPDGKPDVSIEDQLRSLVKVSEMDLKPAFLYFHYPHDDEKKLTPDGRSSLKQCGLLVDVQVSRWAALYRCFEVDMGRSNRETAERLGAGAGTCFAVVDGTTHVTAQSAPFATSKLTVEFLRSTLEKNSPVYWEQLQKQVAAQRVTLAEARKLAAKKEWKASLEKYEEIRRSGLQIGEFFDDVLLEAAKVEAKAKQG